MDYKDEETFKDVFKSIFCIMFGAFAAANASSFGPSTAKAMQAAARIFGIIDVPSNVDATVSHPGALSIGDDFVGKIEFKNVWFRYPSRLNEWVLKDFNLVINPNESCALVGESGSGKSTVVQLILRFYDIDFGQILVDGKDIKDYDVKKLREALGLVQ